MSLLVAFTVSSVERQSSVHTTNNETFTFHHLAFDGLRVDWWQKTPSSTTKRYGVADIRVDDQPGFTGVPLFGDIRDGCTILCKRNTADPLMMGEIVRVLPPSKL